MDGHQPEPECWLKNVPLHACRLKICHYLPTNRVKMRSRDTCSLQSLYQEWEERSITPMTSSTKSTLHTPKVGKNRSRLQINQLNKEHFELALLMEAVVPVQVSTLKILLSSQRNEYRKMSTHKINVSGLGKK